MISPKLKIDWEVKRDEKKHRLVKKCLFSLKFGHIYIIQGGAKVGLQLQEGFLLFLSQNRVIEPE